MQELPTQVTLRAKLDSRSECAEAEGNEPKGLKFERSHKCQDGRCCFQTAEASLMVAVERLLMRHDSSELLTQCTFWLAAPKATESAVIARCETVNGNETVKFRRRCESYFPALLRLLIQAAPVSSSAERIARPSGCEMAAGCGFEMAAGWGLLGT